MSSLRCGLFIILYIFFLQVVVASPVTAGSVERRAMLFQVRNWLYLIDPNGLTEQVVSQIVASSYDMVVLDYIPSEASNQDFPMDEIISRLHNAPHPKLVIAYIDIGQAESYRIYWQEHWCVGNPAWIVGTDPDGWEDNYPVAFWQREWQEIWLGDGGLLNGLQRAGFDGIYLDWLEAYSDENVIAAAERDQVDAQAAMISWVRDLAEYGRARNESFLVIGQNAAELLAEPDYFSILDAVAQEQIWFDGGADNDPPGDCPLPATAADIDSASYYDSLSPACKRQYDAYPESTLHVSSEEYLQDLRPARQMGMPVFTVDYALSEDHIAAAFTQSMANGFVPFASSRALNVFVPVRGRNDGAFSVVFPQGEASVQNPAFGPNGALFYTVFHGGYNRGPAGIYKLDPDGSSIPLLDEDGYDSVNLPGTSWNSATSRLVFSSDRKESDEIWSMNAHGRELHQITSDTIDGYCLEPTFSPDGEWIVFEKDTLAEDDNFQQGSIYKIRVDGTGLTRLTDGPGEGVDDRQPNWSPSGDIILFQRRTPGSDNWDIYTMKPDGSGIHHITNTSASDTDASFSPDGNWIVYSSDYGGLMVPNIFVHPVTGGEPVRITKNDTHEDGAPSWSPDGSWIAFETHPGKDEDTSASIMKISFTWPRLKIWCGNNGETVCNTVPGAEPPIHLSIETGSLSGSNADWWLVLQDPSGRLASFSLTDRVFVSGLRPTYQGSLESFSDVALQNIIPGVEGRYKLYFGVDLTVNGQLDSGSLFYNVMEMVMIALQK